MRRDVVGYRVNVILATWYGPPPARRGWPLIPGGIATTGGGAEGRCVCREARREWATQRRLFLLEEPLVAFEFESAGYYAEG